MESLNKIIFLLANLAVWVLGVLGVIIGMLTHYKYYYMADISTTASYIPYITIGIGAFVTSIGFLGCCAVQRNNTWLLKLYMLYLSALLVVDVGIGVGVYAKKGDVKKGLHDGMANAVLNYNATTAFKHVMDLIQANLKCCGTNSYKDYAYLAPNKTSGYLGYNQTLKMTNHSFNPETVRSTPDGGIQIEKQIRWFTENKFVPESCCVHPNCSCSFVNASVKNTSDCGIFSRGCYNVIESEIQKYSGIIIGAWVGILVIHMMGIGSAVVVKKKIQNTHHYQRIINS